MDASHNLDDKGTATERGSEVVVVHEQESQSMQVDGREQAQQPGDNHHGAKPEQTGGSSLQDAAQLSLVEGGSPRTATMNSGATEAMQASTGVGYIADLHRHFQLLAGVVLDNQGYDSDSTI